MPHVDNKIMPGLGNLPKNNKVDQVIDAKKSDVILHNTGNEDIVLKNMTFNSMLAESNKGTGLVDFNQSKLKTLLIY